MRLMFALFAALVMQVTTAQAVVILDQINNPFSTTMFDSRFSSLSMFATDFNEQFGRAYDDFHTTENLLIERVDWIGAYDGDSTTPADGGGFLTDPADIDPFPFTISIFNDDANSPGSLLESYSIGAGLSNETLVVPITGEGNVFSYSAPISFSATAGVKYWISISATLSFQENGWNLAYAPQQDQDDISVQDFDGTRFVDPVNYAIRLTAIPEPTSGLLTLVGVGICSVGLRRRRHAIP